MRTGRGGGAKWNAFNLSESRSAEFHLEWSRCTITMKLFLGGCGGGSVCVGGGGGRGQVPLPPILRETSPEKCFLLSVFFSPLEMFLIEGHCPVI